MVADTRAHRYDRYQTGSLAGAAIRPRFHTDSRPGAGHTREEATMVQTVQKNIRLSPEQWERIEKAAEERDVSANQLLVELAMEALDRREWPRTRAEIYLLRSAMFTAQAMARDMTAAGRGEEIEEIARNISKVAPELPPDTSDDPDEGGGSGDIQE